MAQILVRVDAAQNAADIRAARAAASTRAMVDERRDMILDAMARIRADDRLPKILEDLALGMFLVGHLERAADARAQLAHAEIAQAELAEEVRLLVRHGDKPQPESAAPAPSAARRKSRAAAR